MDTDRFQRWEEKHAAKRARWEERMAQGQYRSGHSGLITGAIVVTVGILLLLDNLKIVRLYDIWRYWPAVLVAWGVSHALEGRTLSRQVWGALEALIGAFLLLDAFHVISFDIEIFWPLVVIAAGAGILLRGLERNRLRYGAPSAPSLPSPAFGTQAFFSETQSGNETQDFKGGEATAICGAARFDLRNASMTVEEARMDINVLFGEVEVRVPETWSVINRTSAVFAGVNDKTIHPRPDPSVKTPRLVITGVVIFGGVSLRN